MAVLATGMTLERSPVVLKMGKDVSHRLGLVGSVETADRAPCGEREPSLSGCLLLDRVGRKPFGATEAVVGRKTVWVAAHSTTPLCRQIWGNAAYRFLRELCTRLQNRRAVGSVALYLLDLRFRVQATDIIQCCVQGREPAPGCKVSMGFATGCKFIDCACRHRDVTGRVSCSAALRWL